MNQYFKDYLEQHLNKTITNSSLLLPLVPTKKRQHENVKNSFTVTKKKMFNFVELLDEIASPVRYRSCPPLSELTNCVFLSKGITCSNKQKQLKNKAPFFNEAF